MGRTIVQDYGPIYGEPVNGTVQGRPNGSVYVPLSNVIVLDVSEDYRYHRYYNGSVWVCDSSGVFPPAGVGITISAESQDLASNIQVQVYDDSGLLNAVAIRDMTAGQFNWAIRAVTQVGDESEEATFYLRAQLMNNGVAVATSDVIQLAEWSE